MEFYIENLELLSVLQLVSPARLPVPGRPSHAFIFRRSGCVDYDFGTWQTRQNPGEVMLIPKGTVFTATLTDGMESTYTAVNFQGIFSLKEAKKLTLGAEMVKIYAWLDRCAAMDPDRDRYWMLSDFYRIVAQLAQQKQHHYYSQDTMSLIEPALERIQKDLFDPELKVGLLHESCGLSNTYFRSLFVARFGETPKQYILDRRLTHAKQLLESGECRLVSEAARLSGFEDPLYFSRVFKARYGYPPSMDVMR
ncbi:MAG: helix-turn-helix transcriptional regulator [Oscillospiraceae bacterium]|nr:helix-turn-helix transcriptional regulator [Oscillospiraceae bacterium]